ncbi:MAG: methyltransferase domain-containing protein [bacterium]|nr:methyltransferase domain-containing protein [bacterium]
MDDWQNQKFVEHWDSTTNTGNPTREEQLDILLAILADEYQEGKAILDIGFGSGLVEQTIFERIPNAFVVGVDSSKPMIELAKKRLKNWEGQYVPIKHDITKLDSLQLPPKEYQVVISIQTIHNLANADKKKIFDFANLILQDKGLFLILDRIAVNTPGLFSAYQSMWKRLEKIHGAPIKAGDFYGQHVKMTIGKGDNPISIEEHLRMLREAGFEPACLHAHAHRALIGARKC